MNTLKAPLFPTGEFLVTPGALLASIACQANLEGYLERHARGDWGVLDAHDRRVNEEALRNGHRLLSAYDLPADTVDGADKANHTDNASGGGQTSIRIWIITDADRRSSTVLLPDEY
ncbi:hypothetical protein [Armatimonas sp.]|uniref:hypothetical protein n=1 Tax=Armatimonas sp. TaxID=1872638 RepID=UPI00286B4189|nr:hypothetical protein [Armatimonas sp.]